MPVLSFMFRRIQWYRLSGLFGHAGFKVGDSLFLRICLYFIISYFYSPFFFFLSLYLFISSLFLSCSSFLVPSFMSFCVFSLYNFLSSSLSKFSSIFRVVACNLHFLLLFSFLPFCLSLYTFTLVFPFLYVFFVLFFPSVLLTFFFLYSAESEDTILTLLCSVHRYYCQYIRSVFLFLYFSS